MRFAGPVRFRYLGEPKIAQRYVSAARSLLGQLLASHKVTSASRKVKLPDGVVVTLRAYSPMQLAANKRAAFIRNSDLRSGLKKYRRSGLTAAQRAERDLYEHAIASSAASAAATYEITIDARNVIDDFKLNSWNAFYIFPLIAGTIPDKILGLGARADDIFDGYDGDDVPVEPVIVWPEVSANPTYLLRREPTAAPIIDPEEYYTPSYVPEYLQAFDPTEMGGVAWQADSGLVLSFGDCPTERRGGVTIRYVDSNLGQFAAGKIYQRGKAIVEDTTDYISACLYKSDDLAQTSLRLIAVAREGTTEAPSDVVYAFNATNNFAPGHIEVNLESKIEIGRYDYTPGYYTDTTDYVELNLAPWLFSSDGTKAVACRRTSNTLATLDYVDKPPGPLNDMYIWPENGNGVVPEHGSVLFRYDLAITEDIEGNLVATITPTQEVLFSIRYDRDVVVDYTYADSNSPGITGCGEQKQMFRKNNQTSTDTWNYRCYDYRNNDLVYLDIFIKRTTNYDRDITWKYIENASTDENGDPVLFCYYGPVADPPNGGFIEINDDCLFILSNQDGELDNRTGRNEFRLDIRNPDLPSDNPEDIQLAQDAVRTVTGDRIAMEVCNGFGDLLNDFTIDARIPFLSFGSSSALRTPADFNISTDNDTTYDRVVTDGFKSVGNPTFGSSAGGYYRDAKWFAKHTDASNNIMRYLAYVYDGKQARTPLIEADYPENMEDFFTDAGYTLMPDTPVWGGWIEQAVYNGATDEGSYTEIQLDFTAYDTLLGPVVGAADLIGLYMYDGMGGTSCEINKEGIRAVFVNPFLQQLQFDPYQTGSVTLEKDAPMFWEMWHPNGSTHDYMSDFGVNAPYSQTRGIILI